MKRTKKEAETEKWVDEYILKNNRAPTYEELKVYLKVSKVSAWNRCKKFREKMKQIKALKAGKEHFTRVKLEYMVANDKFGEFAGLLTQINNLLKKITCKK